MSPLYQRVENTASISVWYNLSMDNYDPTLYNPLALDNEFVTNLRNALKESYATGMANLNNQRYLDQSSIMNAANKAGSLFSNVPQRMKLQYDTNTFMPNQIKLRQSYQSGLDSLRENAINAANQVAYYQQMINHYNTLPTSSGSSSTSATDIANAVQEELAGV